MWLPRSAARSSVIRAASLVCCVLTNQVRPAAAAIATTTATITQVRPVRDR